MTTTPERQHTSPVDEPVELLEYLAALVARRYWILATVVLAGLVALAASFWLEPTYRVSTRVAVVEPPDPGGVNPGSFRYREALTVIETGFVLRNNRDNHVDVVTARLGSKAFAARFIEDVDAMPLLFPDRWDRERERWIDPAQAPTLSQGAAVFTKEICSVETDLETGIVDVTFRWRHPAQVARWANRFVELFNEIEKAEAIEEVEGRTSYLKEQLRATSFVEIERAVYRIIEAQTEIGMLASVDPEYALDVIDPAVTPSRPASPRRGLMLAGSIFVTSMLSISFVVGRILLRRIRDALGSFDSGAEG